MLRNFAHGGLLEQPLPCAGCGPRLRPEAFDQVASITAYLVFAGWTELVTTLITGIPPPQPPPTTSNPTTRRQ